MWLESGNKVKHGADDGAQIKAEGTADRGPDQGADDEAYEVLMKRAEGVRWRWLIRMLVRALSLTRKSSKRISF
jgi:hypothetical protein